MENRNALLFGLQLTGDDEFNDSLAELENLALSCGYTTLEIMTQKSEKISPRFYIGSGKVIELKERIAIIKADLVIFDQELSPIHYRNLEEALEVKVLDRTMLILEIFELRAHSPVSKLQVSLARDQYMLPRIIGQYRELSRQRGATSTIGGPGEQKLELERRRLRDNITRDRKELAKLVKQRRVQRQRRIDSGTFTVALVGYTNAGKSTLLNRLYEESRLEIAGDKRVYVEDQLFATLETSSRLIVMPNNRRFIAIDTVGFVRHMPAHLIAAFRSTLEEITEADLIVMVMDGAAHDMKAQGRVVTKALTDIGVQDKPFLFVRNKIDLVGNLPKSIKDENIIDVSSTKGTGFIRLMARVSVAMDFLYEEVVLAIPYDRQDLIGVLHKEGFTFHTDYGVDKITIDAEIPKRCLTKYMPFIVAMGDQAEYHPS